MPATRLLSVLLALRFITLTSAVPGRLHWPPAAALNGVLPAWLDLPDGDDIKKDFGLDVNTIDQQPLQVNSFFCSCCI